MLQRLRIVNDYNQVAYDEMFHAGVNIIRGQNSSGKSTIVRFIFFALGGAYSEFVPEALRCQYVMAEVNISGTVVTLKRPLEKLTGSNRINPQSPMYIYYGMMDEALEDHSRDAWCRFGYKTTPERKSFSNILFDLMGMPEMRLESNVTMHQLLRLVYLDQESPTSSLFFFERFDKENIRETVSDLLLGVYDEDLTNAKLHLSHLETQLKELKGSIRIANDFLSRPETRSSAFIREYIDRLNTEIEQITVQIEQQRSDMVFRAVRNKKEYRLLQEDIARQRRIVTDLQSEINSLQTEVQDSQYFIDFLQKKVDALVKSMAARDSFEMTNLEYCPACLTRLDDNVPEGHCKLCKSPIDNTRGRAQAARIKMELEFQMAESRKNLEENNGKLTAKNIEFSSERKRLATLQRQFDNSMRHVRTSKEEALDMLFQQKGFKEGEILQYQTLLETALRYEEMMSHYKDLQYEYDDTDYYIKAQEKVIERRRVAMMNAITGNGVYLLNKDEQRQQEFINAREFYVNFSQNMVYTTNQYTKLSASSGFYLKMAARFAIFLASLQNDTMLYPRLLFSDNMEDKGMEENRAKNFQRTIVSRLKEMPNQNYQLIFATSNIAEELDIPSYTVGESYTQENKSLKNV